MLRKIISGGQTGADRAALDFAIWHDIPHGGWCPKGRLCEEGVIDKRYQLVETSSKSYLQRTERNIKDSDGTVIFTVTPHLTGGSKRTAEFARKHRKPWLHLHGELYDREDRLLDFIADNKIGVLNVAGSRASKEPGVYEFVKQTLEGALFPKPCAWLGGKDEG
jgi:hypothetical protein